MTVRGRKTSIDSVSILARYATFSSPPPPPAAAAGAGAPALTTPLPAFRVQGFLKVEGLGLRFESLGFTGVPRS